MVSVAFNSCWSSRCPGRTARRGWSGDGGRPASCTSTRRCRCSASSCDCSWRRAQGRDPSPGNRACCTPARGQRSAPCGALSEDDVLIDACLYLLIVITIGETSIRRSAHDLPVTPSLPYHRLVVETVVEALDVVDLLGVGILRDAVVAKFGDVIVDVIIVVREVLKGIDLVGEAAPQRLPETGVGLMRVERAVAVRSIQVPSLALLGGDDVDHASQGIRAEAYGHHSLVDLDTLGVVHGEVVQVQCLPCPLLWHTVDEDLDMTAAEAVQHQLHVRTHAATLAQLHAGRLGQGVAQAFWRSCAVRWHPPPRHCRPNASHVPRGGCDHYFVQLPVLGAEGKSNTRRAPRFK